MISDQIRRDHPNAEEIKPATRRYNCHGFTFAGSHGWVNDPDIFLDNDYRQVSFNNPQVNDVVMYDDHNAGAHSAIVTKVRNRRITRVQSKWGLWSEVSHDLTDLPASLGLPRSLHRKIVTLLEGDELLGSLEAQDPAATQASIRSGLGQISDPQVYTQVGLASTPEALRKIIETLPGVNELIAVGPEASDAVVNFLENEDVKNNEMLSSIALFLIQKTPTTTAAQLLAKGLDANRFRGFNQLLAAEAFLASTGIVPAGKDTVAEVLSRISSLLSS